MNDRIEILGIGMAIVDRSWFVGPKDLDYIGINQGDTRIISVSEFARIKKKLGSPISITPGGSVGNALAAATIAGAHTALWAPLGDDSDGQLIRKDLADRGIADLCPPSLAGLPSSNCLILIGPDGERSILGAPGAACASVSVMPVSHMAATILVDPYLFWMGDNRMREAIIHRQINTMTATFLPSHNVLGDALAVVSTLLGRADIIFGSGQDWKAFHTLNRALAAQIEEERICLQTHGAMGVELIMKGDRTYCEARVEAKAIDTTGAGDTFAGVFLACIVRNLDPQESIYLAQEAARRSLDHIGARNPTCVY